MYYAFWNQNGNNSTVPEPFGRWDVHVFEFLGGRCWPHPWSHIPLAVNRGWFLCPNVKQITQLKRGKNPSPTNICVGDVKQVPNFVGTSIHPLPTPFQSSNDRFPVTPSARLLIGFWEPPWCHTVPLAFVRRRGCTALANSVYPTQIPWRLHPFCTMITPPWSSPTSELGKRCIFFYIELTYILHLYWMYYIYITTYGYNSI